MTTLNYIAGLTIGAFVVGLNVDNADEMADEILARGTSLNEFQACKIDNARRGRFNVENCPQLDWVKEMKP